MAPIRVLVTDDSGLARELLRALLESDAGIQVVGEAGNGSEAVRLARELRPDLITMDLEMPVMGGLEAIEEIMCSKAVPILVVSSVADAQNACEAVARGALEVIAKPELDAAAAERLIDKVKLLAGVPVITHLRKRPLRLPSIAPQSTSFAPAAPAPALGDARKVFAIASSTGGPQALALILARLPADFASPILIAQHIADGFAPGMAEWLNGQCALPVRIGSEGEPVMPGTVYISPSEDHLAVTPARRLTLVQRRPGDIYHPSCDVLLASVGEVYGRHGVGVILTGMGSDGVRGMERIAAAGGRTFAQDEATSVVFGMNRVAIERGLCQQVVPLERIAPLMIEQAGLAAPAPAFH